jgi:hypothetical protein
MSTKPIDDTLRDISIRCQQAEEERDAARYELEQMARMFRDAKPDGTAESYLRIWSNCLNNMLYPKAHWIDALGMTTRRLNSDKERAESKFAQAAVTIQKLESEREVMVKALQQCHTCFMTLEIHKGYSTEVPPNVVIRAVRDITLALMPSPELKTP